MRNWINLLLLLCIVALGTVAFNQQRRIAQLEARLQPAPSGMAAAQLAATGGGTAAARLGEDVDRIEQPPAALAGEGATSETGRAPVTVRLSDAEQARARQLIEWQYRQEGGEGKLVPAQPFADRNSRLPRGPAGEINGIPYYHLPLSHVGK